VLLQVPVAPGGRALPCLFPRLIAHLVHVGRRARASTWSAARCQRRRQLLQVIVIVIVIEADRRDRCRSPVKRIQERVKS
jgi:hypothetical protein